jgi:bacillolysin
MRSRSLLAATTSGLLVAAAVLVATTTSATTASGATPGVVRSGSFALSGADAAAYRLPPDVRAVTTASLSQGRTQTRYQQYVGAASVLGGQVTVTRDASGVARTVIGAHFPNVTATATVALTRGQATRVVTDRIGTRGHSSSALRLDPRTGRPFWVVDTIRASHRPVRWVDAATGRVIRAYDGLAEGEGTGVKGDTKDIDTTLNEGTGLYELITGDGRQVTKDAQNRLNNPIVMTDDNNVWDLPGATSPGQAAGVDAHYYGGVVDDFYGLTFARDSIDDNGMTIESHVHVNNRWCNASWNGEFMRYGDGDGRTCGSLAGALDVVAHELTHGVTDFSSDLIYQDQSGALNESFSDMMGSTVEFFAEEQNLDPLGEPDWLIAEDVYDARRDPTGGFRNMSDPAQDGHPDHMVDFLNTTSDSGGVHINSGIPNHAYYLAVNGGQNAGCTAGLWRSGPTHTEDCEISVPAVGLDASAQIFYEAFTGLTEYANFCDARMATVATATSLYPAQAAAVGQAWDAVGVHDGCTGGIAPPPQCEPLTLVDTVPFGSSHPYRGDADCRWTFDNGSPGFRFHFSLLDTERNYDYVHVEDGNGEVLASYTGRYRRGVTSPCITTSTGTVRLVTDPAVVGEGFTVDAVEPC